MRRKSSAANYKAFFDDPEDNYIDCLQCVVCNITFSCKVVWHHHHFNHLRELYVNLDRPVDHPSLRITLKNRDGNNFQIVSPTPSTASSEPGCRQDSLDEEILHTNYEESYFDEGQNHIEEEPQSTVDQILNEFGTSEDNSRLSSYSGEDRSQVNFSPNLAEVIGGAFLADIGSPIPFETPSTSENSNTEGASAQISETSTDNTEGLEVISGGSHVNSPPYGSIPGAEPTPPPEPSPTGATEYPRIKLKANSALFPDEPQRCTITEITDDNPNGDPNVPGGSSSNQIFTTPSLEDSLQLPESMQLFNNTNNKDLGYSSSSENEFISLETFNERNRSSRPTNQLQPYNPQTSNTTLDSITGLPIQALAHQVSRLNNQPNSSQMHQQNVLINIQQFPSQPPQQPYPPQHMYPPPPQYQPPMYPPYQAPPNPMYPYGAGGYPPPHNMGPPPQMPQPQQQMPPNSMAPTSQAQQMPPPHQLPQPSQGGYRAPMPPSQRGPAPRPSMGGRMPGPRPMGNRPPGGVRPRGPMGMRPRGPGASPMRGQMRPNQSPRPQNSPTKRAGPQPMDIKRRRVDVLTTEKDDDDCQVICMQPKNTGLPQIESVQGGPERVENTIMKLPDSITLTKKVVSPQKAEAKAVANVLASRGITVTATKPKEPPPRPNVSTSLNGVSISPKKQQDEGLPTVDLTDDSPTNNSKGLPYKCDLCSAQYPNAQGLSKHTQQYHKTKGGMCELGVPLINLKQPGIMQKLSSLGINNYVPLLGAGSDGRFALPIISTRNPGNMQALGATQMLSLGQVRPIPKNGPPNSPAK